MSYVTYKGKQMFYHESGEGEPLLLLHGNTASSRMFEEVVKFYQQDFKVILIDFLGHGKSERLTNWPIDLWYEEALQAIHLLQVLHYHRAYVIGTSGGALVAINMALEAPELIAGVVADSFEGEHALKAITQHIEQDREYSKQNPQTVQFYQNMHGDDWENVVDHDTAVVAQHAKEIGAFFHQELTELSVSILLTGSKQDEFVCDIMPDYFTVTYQHMLDQIRHGTMHIFESGGHPAMLSNDKAFYEISRKFLKGVQHEEM